MASHIVQSPQWGEFKTKYGTPAIRAGGVQYTKHKVPFTNDFFAYCPKVNPAVIEWDTLKKSLEEQSCFSINFDAPNVVAGTDEAQKANEVFEQQGKCVKSPKNTFTKWNILLDITRTEDELLATMHKKHRYNIKKAQQNGLAVELGQNTNDFDTFFRLLAETADRQKFLIHPKGYYKLIWELLHPQGMAELLLVKHAGESVAAWMLFVYEGTLYYPYGGSDPTNKNLYASNLLGWEAIVLGKKLGCTLFDMWGACQDPNNEKDPEWGFTNFKLKFGGTHVEYIDSYDLVVDKTKYTTFSFANSVRWKLLRLKK